MSYRPITDVWIMGRPKVPYYGSYPGGFVERARALLGVDYRRAVLHVCSGRVKDYPFRGVSGHDLTLDGNPELKPDFVCDVTSQPLPDAEGSPTYHAILTDPPYTEEDAQHYGQYREDGVVLPFPNASHLMKKCLSALPIGGRVGMLHYVWPACPDFAKEVAVISVLTGRRQRARVYTVMERLT